MESDYHEANFAIDITVRLNGADPNQVTVVYTDSERKMSVRGRSITGADWQRSWSLPKDVNSTGIDLNVENGDLTIIIPKM